MKGFDYLSPDGFYDAIKAYGLPQEIIDLDREAQHEVKCFIQTAYGATVPITVSEVSKQGGPVLPLKSTYTTSMGHYYMRDILKQDDDALEISSMSKARKDPHTLDANLSLLVAMVEATDDSYIFSKSIDSLRKSALIMERFQYAYGWLTQWTKSNAYVLAPDPNKTYPDVITFDSVSTGDGVNPLDITTRTIALIKDDMDFLRTKVDNPSARFLEMRQIIEEFQFPTIIGRLPLTVIRKIVAQNLVSKCRALLSLQPIMPDDATKLDKLIIKKVHEVLGFPFQPSTDIAMLPISLHGFGFPSISVINASLAMEGLQRDLNHHIPAYRDMARITMADWICEKAECSNPVDGSGQRKDYKRQQKQIPASWIVGQIAMTAIGMSLKRTDQSDILQGDVSLSHVVNVCNQRIPQSDRTVNGTTLLSLKRKGILLLNQVGIWTVEREGEFRIQTTMVSDKRWSKAAQDNWEKIKKMIEGASFLDQFTTEPDLLIPRRLREQRAENYIHALSNISALAGSKHTDGQTWATDGSAVPASARILEIKHVMGAATGDTSLVMRIQGRNISILNGEQSGLIIALIEISKKPSGPQKGARILTDHLNSVRLINDSQTHISQIPRLRYMNGRSYYRWIISILERLPSSIKVEYTPGHSDEKTMEAGMNDEADRLASSSQKSFKNIPEFPNPTFHMNEFTYYHRTDGWIESGISQYVNARMNIDKHNRLARANGHRMATWVHDETDPPEYPYIKAMSAHSAAVQLYARSGQLATADILKKRNKNEDDICRLDCGNATESPRHLFLKCPTYDSWREDATKDVVERTILKAETMGISQITTENLTRAAKSLFADNETIWPLHVSLYYLGQIPKIDDFLNDGILTKPQKLRIKSHISSDWHTAAIRLAGRIFGDFQKRMAVLNRCPHKPPNLR